MFSFFFMKRLGSCQTIQVAAPKRSSRLWQVLLALMLGLPLSGWAATTCSNSNGNQPYPLLFTYTDTMRVDNSVEVGDVVGSMTTTLAMAGGGGRSSCTGSGVMNLVGIGAYTVLKGRNVYPSSVEGIGFAIYSVNSPPTGYFPLVQPGAYRAWDVNGGAIIRVELVKTGPITHGGSLSGPFAYSTIKPTDGSPSFNHTVFLFNGSVPVVPANPTCSVATPDVQVNLVAAEASNLPNVNDTLNEKDFKVSLSCSGGDAGTKTAVWMSLTDQTTPANTTTTLTLNPSTSTATGVGIQVLRSGTPINWAPAVNRFKVQDVLPGNSTVDIPFKARYIRTAGPIGPGTVEAIATFTMEYP